MNKIVLLALSLLILLGACGPAVPTGPLPTETIAASPTAAVPSATATSEPSTAPLYPLEGYGPGGFPADVNPLTGLVPGDPALLDRRPLLVKISNLPRTVRPQWGLSLADIVFEYYTEEGTTRFAALFYGNDASIVGPIRSARFMDAHLVRGYKAAFAFGSAYDKVIERLYNAEYFDQLFIEGSSSPMTRYDPNGMNHLVVDTADLSAAMSARAAGNARQDLDGMFFQLEAPSAALAGSGNGTTLVVRFSGSIYDRWDYDPAAGRYLRFVDETDDFNGGLGEVYTQATDRLTEQPLASDNVVVLFALYELYNEAPEVRDVQLVGSGPAYLFRDGRAYQLTWVRDAFSVVTLIGPGGAPFPFKPGTTWFEVVGSRSTVEVNGQGWRFIHYMP
jgi:hypothetical protein